MSPATRGRVTSGVAVAALVGVVLLIADPQGRDAGPPSSASPPEPVSAAEFCGLFDALTAAHGAALAAAGTPDGAAGEVPALREAAQAARDAAARTSGMPDDARQGIAFVAGLFLALPDEPTRAELLSSSTTPSLVEQAHATAFADYLAAACAPDDPVAGVPG